MVAAVEESINAVIDKIAAACARVGRDPTTVTLVAVSKYVEVERINEAITCGVRICGENRVQELVRKYEEIGDAVMWHLIGHLQRNKAHYLPEKVSLIHSLDSLELAKELDRLACVQKRPWQVLIQVNVADEATKFGINPSQLPHLLDEVLPLEGIQVRGLMTMAPYSEDPEATRPVFRGLRQLQEQMMAARPGLDLLELSMGMSNDFEVAIEEGATLVRIGSAIFSNEH